MRTIKTRTITLNAQKDQDHVTIQYHTEGAERNAILFLAVVQKAAQTKVQRGENSGRTLSHVQIVRKMQSLAISTGGKGYTTIALPEGFNLQGFEAIGFVQNTGNGAISAAAKSAFDTNSAGKLYIVVCFQFINVACTCLN